MHPYHKIITTRFKTDLIIKFLKSKKFGKILDIGCGSGYILHEIRKHFPNSDLYGVDLESKSIDLAKKITNEKYQVANAEKLSEYFEKEFFDCVISTDVMEHIENYKENISEVYKILKPGGIFYVYTPSINGILSKSKMADLYHQNSKSLMYDQRYFTNQGLANDLKDANFKIIENFQHNFFAQEIITQLIKFFLKFIKKEYDNQGDIYNLTKSKWYNLYKIFFPLIYYIVKSEEFVVEKLFNNKLNSHRLVFICQK
jgi:ubiquinone/menaquinone biosynthesis C-methylase UbiE